MDELNAPLGQNKREKEPSKLRNLAPQVLAGLLGLSAIAVVVWAMIVKDPLGGEPTAVVSVVPPKPAADKQAGDQHAQQDKTAHDATPAVKVEIPAAVTPPPGSKTVTIIDGSSGKHQDVVLPGKDGDAAPKTSGSHSLLESTPQGSIPKIAADGARAFRAYAHPRALPPDKTNAPRIAVIVGGLGISTTGTTDALAKLPAPITLAIAPYGGDLNRVVDRAAAAGHEVLLQSPMEPFDYPDNDPGPQTLLTSLTSDQNIERLHWQMSRMQGYVGIVSYMGARFTASDAALGPVLRDTAARGLIYVDDGASPRSIAGQIATANGFPFAKTDVAIDAVPSTAEIDRALARLELVARERGSAVGLATALPATITRIAAWAKSVESRGFVLVPITMVAMKDKSS